MGAEYVGIVMTVLLVGFIAFLVLLGKYHPRSGADVLDWRPTRSPEVEAQNELDDVAQMIEAANERRRRMGKPERTEEQIRAEVEAHERAVREHREKYLADIEIEQMLAAKNERRRARGKPELTLEEYKATLRDLG